MGLRKCILAVFLLSVFACSISAQKRKRDTTDIYYLALYDHLTKYPRPAWQPVYFSSDGVVARNIPDTVAGRPVIRTDISKIENKTLQVTGITAAHWHNGQLKIHVSVHNLTREKRKRFRFSISSSSDYIVTRSADGERFVIEPLEGSGYITSQPDTTDIYYRVLADHLRHRNSGNEWVPPDLYLKRYDTRTGNVPDSVAGHSITKVRGLHEVPGGKR